MRTRKLHYHLSHLEVTDGGFGGALVRAVGALCPDGVRRTARPTGGGWPDTFFSIPATVKVRGRSVSGYVTIATDDGYSTPEDQLTVMFRPNAYGKNADAFNHPGEAA